MHESLIWRKFKLAIFKDSPNRQIKVLAKFSGYTVYSNITSQNAQEYSSKRSRPQNPGPFLIDFQVYAPHPVCQMLTFNIQLSTFQRLVSSWPIHIATLNYLVTITHVSSTILAAPYPMHTLSIKWFGYYHFAN